LKQFYSTFNLQNKCNLVYGAQIEHFIQVTQ
jgi:hypothetical protein